MNWFAVPLLIAALLLRPSAAAAADSSRHARQVIYRGNQKFQVPDYLRQSLTPDHFARTVYSNEHREGDGSFGYQYQTDNGISVQQDSSGYGPNKVVRGFYSYIGPDGKQYTVNYVADRFGYRAYGDHLPTQPNHAAPVGRPAPTDYFERQPQLQQQHLTQTAFYPAETLQSQQIFVTEHPPVNFVSITPKPLAEKPLSVISVLPPLNYPRAPAYNQIAWTTQRPYV